MADVLERHTTDLPALAPRFAPDERPARRSLLDQVERLEGELSSVAVSTWPRKGFDFSVPARGGPRLLTLGELEQVRDDMAERLALARGDREAVARREEGYRCLIEEMLLAPEEHKWVRVGNEDIGEPGCKHWHVRPRWGVVGMLLNWWRVKISSGCPLAGGYG
ncbi:MAG TPA: hypothetical protein VEX39_10115 [Thermoleophilaceae bacterium]|nr:hypothetical protein [Thermoleophilaceae bacterium]